MVCEVLGFGGCSASSVMGDRGPRGWVQAMTKRLPRCGPPPREKDAPGCPLGVVFDWCRGLSIPAFAGLQLLGARSVTLHFHPMVLGLNRTP